MTAVAVARPVTADVASVLTRLSGYLNLGPGWDGEGAAAPSPVALQSALRFLLEQLPAGPAPSVGPAPDGSIEMEWELPGRPCVSVTFEPTGLAYLTVFTRDRVLREGEYEPGAALASMVIDTIG